ncbi:MAG TPA: GAF domain-containing protein [Candidatus Sulfotelmatobacter sp.]
MNPAAKPSAPNRRRRVRHKIQAPAYASFTGAHKGKMPDLNEILDISEDGVAVQCASALDKNRSFDLCLDLAEATGQIFTSGQVIWSDTAGRCGFHFSDLPPASLFHLREWLFLNAMAGIANAQALRQTRTFEPDSPVFPSHSDTLAALSVIQREVESAGSNLEAALNVIANRAQNLTRATGSAIALVAAEPGFMVCRASSGPDAPPSGSRLQVGSGFSGECVRSGKLLRCDDCETDDRVDQESCRALALRSILAAPIKASGTVIGLLEVLSARAHAFTQADCDILQRLADLVLAAVNRAGRHGNSNTIANKVPYVSSSPGSVLFAPPAGEEKKEKKEKDVEEQSDGKSPATRSMIQLPRSYLFVLICTAATIALVLGYYFAPDLQARFQKHGTSVEQTVLASSPPPAAAKNSVDAMRLPRLQQLAAQGDPAAENAIGLLYAQGDDKEKVAHDEKEAARWFMKAAEHGNTAAQSKLGSLYWSGRGVPQDFNKAYFWTVLARAGGDDASKALAPFVAARLTGSQAQSIEQQAEVWFQQHQSQSNPEAHR